MRVPYIHSFMPHATCPTPHASMQPIFNGISIAISIPITISHSFFIICLACHSAHLACARLFSWLSASQEEQPACQRSPRCSLCCRCCCWRVCSAFLLTYSLANAIMLDLNAWQRLVRLREAGLNKRRRHTRPSSRPLFKLNLGNALRVCHGNWKASPRFL